MDNSEKKLQQLIKSASLPELSADFTSRVMERTSFLPKTKLFPDKPLIHPLVLWLGFLLPAIIIIIALFVRGNSSQVLMLNFHTNFNLFYYLKQFSSNYLIISFATLVLIWFLIDFKLINFRKLNK